MTLLYAFIEAYVMWIHYTRQPNVHTDILSIWESLEKDALSLATLDTTRYCFTIPAFYYSHLCIVLHLVHRPSAILKGNKNNEILNIPQKPCRLINDNQFQLQIAESVNNYFKSVIFLFHYFFQWLDFLIK